MTAKPRRRQGRALTHRDDRRDTRSAPFLDLPSASLRARYSRVVGSRRARVTAMMCSAWLSWRSPPRCRRCRWRFPDERGIGATPDWRAKLASVANPSPPAVCPIWIAAVSAPQPVSPSGCGRCALMSAASSDSSAFACDGATARRGSASPRRLLRCRWTCTG
jgi:hypothetical protein